MWEGFIVATICHGWLCKAIHGEEYRHQLRGRFPTEDACKAEGELVLEFAALDRRFAPLDLRPRVECVRK